MLSLDWKTALIICAFLTLSFYGLIDLARQGELIAWVILMALMGMLLILGLMGGLVLFIKTIKTGEERSFAHNTRENLALLRQMQLLQNAQTASLARRNAHLEQQLNRQLPATALPPPSLLFEAEIFEDLDQIEPAAPAPD